MCVFLGVEYAKGLMIFYNDVPICACVQINLCDGNKSTNCYGDR
jgi:hypothetical protein